VLKDGDEWCDQKMPEELVSKDRCRKARMLRSSSDHESQEMRVDTQRRGMEKYRKEISKRQPKSDRC